jgi:hypothetical protein
MAKQKPQGSVDEKICHLCRLIFMPRTPTDPLRAPFFGAPALLPFQSMSPVDWPYTPFAIVDEVPLSILGYNFEGIWDEAMAERYSQGGGIGH